MATGRKRVGIDLTGLQRGFTGNIGAASAHSLSLFAGSSLVLVSRQLCPRRPCLRAAAPPCWLRQGVQHASAMGDPGLLQDTSSLTALRYQGSNSCRQCSNPLRSTRSAPSVRRGPLWPPRLRPLRLRRCGGGGRQTLLVFLSQGEDLFLESQKPGPGSGRPRLPIRFCCPGRRRGLCSQAHARGHWGKVCGEAFLPLNA